MEMVIPDDINDIFLINQNPTKPSNVHEKPEQITKKDSTDTIVNIMSPIAQELDSA